MPFLLKCNANTHETQNTQPSEYLHTLLVCVLVAHALHTSFKPASSSFECFCMKTDVFLPSPEVVPTALPPENMESCFEQVWEPSESGDRERPCALRHGVALGCTGRRVISVLLCSVYFTVGTQTERAETAVRVTSLHSTSHVLFTAHPARPGSRARLLRVLAAQVF